MKEILAEGVWCKTCEMFEEPDISNGRCLACGCAAATHVEVEVITS